MGSCGENKNHFLPSIVLAFSVVGGQKKWCSWSLCFAHTRLAYHTAAGKMAKLDGDHHRVQRTTGTDHQEFFLARKNKTSRQPISNYCTVERQIGPP